MQVKGLEEMGTYKYRFQNTVVQYIVMRTILELLLEADRGPGSRLPKKWLDQEGLDFTCLHY